MRKRDIETARNLDVQLLAYSKEVRGLPGVEFPENRETLIAQLIDSIRRIKYVEVIRQRRLSPLRGEAGSDMFDPIKAAVIHTKNGNIDEASWLIFLATHFGKSGKDGWSLAQVFYSALGQGFTWDWKRATYNPDRMVEWLERNYQEISDRKYRFGNHRKYESMNPARRSFTGIVLRSYVHWVLASGSHIDLFGKALERHNQDPRQAFRDLYKSMSAVCRFGRTGRFDYLTMIGKVGVANIQADSTYMGNATGPYDGAKLLFLGRTNGEASRRTLDQWIVSLDTYLDVGMQVLEDALCNWQKSPGKYIQFRG
ncbi:alpha-glutamyl/putrescinyl thymine pyrophosphorylase clade 3 protein [Pseudomonas aeruginosa]|uniref:alpha-glutamyl/putrescinyl thymine pyrophosphorylase clade 3 protein n=1 Tax=Pseudomonas aeruginosa TaxID=287 RepID=UPI0008FB1966|nr:hypothetical protein [Pseudomonas aeruginosa]MBG4729557.1 hypothetical protein [Pseudomonas aeruginosa]MCQ9840019.1 hypothetical protein [Pseudomonas aeruginosa]MCQ9865997.1 hypothetical protein [Pseudomonas aeruginosa]MCS8057219.1 hypothetical protein [Pseudomonas aeruginosa]MCT0838659.1 hypothetical protein [Pseudomonas aeruginosa]